MGNKNNKTFELHNYLELKGGPDIIINQILEKIPNLDDIGYAGYLEKKWLRMTLERLIPNKDGENQYYLYKEEYKEKINDICEEVLMKCMEYTDKKVHIFLFPTFDKFAIERMKGVSGFCPWKNTILIFINFVNGWENQLKETIVHEFAHSQSPFAKHDAPIGDWIVLEGLAENFKDFILSSKRSYWTMAISKEESKKLFIEIKPILKENNFGKYSEVFFGTGKYPLWAGYSIGYYLVKNYLKNKKEIDWNKLLRKNPKEILAKVIS